MEYRINNKKVRFNPYNMKYSKCLGIGGTASVYLINNDAYKFYKFGKRENITPFMINSFSKIKTQRIILPKKVIYNKKRRFSGYISDYIENLGYDNLLNLDREKLIDELKLLWDDFILMGNENILVNDACINNTSFNNGCYLVDVGRFMYGRDVNTSISYNIEEFRRYLIYYIFGNWLVNNKKTAYFEKINSEYRSMDYNSSPIDYLERDMVEDNLEQFLKRKVK